MSQKKPANKELEEEMRKHNLSYIRPEERELQTSMQNHVKTGDKNSGRKDTSTINPTEKSTMDAATQHAHERSSAFTPEAMAQAAKNVEELQKQISKMNSWSNRAINAGMAGVASGVIVGTSFLIWNWAFGSKVPVAVPGK